MNYTESSPPQEFLDGRHSRTERLIGQKAVDKLCKVCITILGLGGVGSYIVEALARAGVQNFILVDKDKISESNINRQLIATYNTIGMLKTDVAQKRILSINPQARVKTYPIFCGKDTINSIDFSTSDYIADAIDNITAKILLAQRAKEIGIPIISAMGTGNKLNPNLFQITDIYKTSVCPLAKVLRRELKKRGVQQLTVVYSPELPHAELPSRTPASISFVPATAGLLMASKIIQDLTNSSC